MLSNVTSGTVAPREVPADDAEDFEWVNAWAASASPQASSSVAREPLPQGTALVQELAHIPSKERAAEPPANEPQRVAPASPEPTDAMADPGPAIHLTDAEQEAEPAAELVASAEAPACQAASGEEMAGDPPAREADAAAATTMDMTSRAVATELVELVDEQPAAEDGSASAPIAFLDLARRAKRWRSLFGIAGAGAPRTEVDSTDPLEALPASSDPVAAEAVILVDLAPAIAPDQLERDMVEIAARRDVLLSEWEQARRVPVEPPRTRTSQYVPILLGSVLGFTLLVAFGAAASFVSLR
jgi:hypothetical protein